jgi:hypothetical protein
MKSIIKSAALTVFLASMLCITPERAYPIGEFSVGVNLGFTYDPNNLEEEMSRYNMVMESFKEANAGSSVTQLSIPYAPVFGVNLRYQFNFFLFRLGCHYSQPMGGVKGSITPAGGVKNTIEMSTYQISYPATIGLIIPLRERTYFYIGTGATFHSAYVEIKQSNPGQAVGGPPTLQTAFTNA